MSRVTILGLEMWNDNFPLYEMPQLTIKLSGLNLVFSFQ